MHTVTIKLISIAGDENISFYLSEIVFNLLFRRTRTSQQGI